MAGALFSLQHLAGWASIVALFRPSRCRQHVGSRRVAAVGELREIRARLEPGSADRGRVQPNSRGYDAVWVPAACSSRHSPRQQIYRRQAIGPPCLRRTICRGRSAKGSYEQPEAIPVFCGTKPGRSPSREERRSGTRLRDPTPISSSHQNKTGASPFLD